MIRFFPLYDSIGIRRTSRETPPKSPGQTRTAHDSQFELVQIL